MKLIKEEVRVRWSDTDQAGIVHFTNFFVYFEVAEQRLLREVLKLGLTGRSQGKVFRPP